jgi:hypothetical protein
MAESVPITFPLTYFEYKATFADPLFELWSAPDRALQKALYKALTPWGITLDNVLFPTQPKNTAEWQLTFNLLQHRSSITLGIGGITLSVNNPDWSQAGLVSAIAGAAVGAVRGAGGTSLANQITTLAMHLTPLGTTARHIMAPFVNLREGVRSRLGEPKNLGFSIYGQSAVWVVDASAVFSESLFVRLLRTHGGDIGIAEILEALEGDERGILSMLGLHENVTS